MAGLCSKHQDKDPNCPLCHANPKDLFPDWEEKLAEAEAAGLAKCPSCDYEFYLTGFSCPLCGETLKDPIGIDWAHPKIKRVGYWRPIPVHVPVDIIIGDDRPWPHLPDVRELEGQLDLEVAYQVARYLVEHGELAQEALGVPHWDGFHSCRFEGCISGRHLGGLDMTDGQWVWPEGLPHYAVVHRVGLPEAFLRHVEASMGTKG